MKKLSIATIVAVLAALLVATVAFAMFTNGNFENGDFTGWVKDANYLNGGILVGPPPSYVPLAVTSSEGVLYGAVASDNTYIVNTAWMNANFGAGVTCDPNTNGSVCLPYAGANSAVVNYLGAMYLKNNNMNTLSQQGLVAGGDVAADGNYHIFFAYAPVLDKGSHTPSDQPFMHVKLTRVRAGSPDQVLFDKFSYPDDGNPNWKWNTSIPSIAYMNWQVYDLTYAPADLNAGDTLNLDVTAAGCVYFQGGHWGYVYVDEFGPTAPSGNTAPSISSLSPSSGLDSGGTLITIVGSHFTGATAVKIGTTTYSSGSFTVVDDTHITVTTTAHPAGLVDVSVTNPSGSAVYPYSFTFLALPTITNGGTGGGTAPNYGPVTGGTTVIITGTNLTGGAFTFGGLPAVCTVNPAGTQATCTTPAHTAGPVDVTVTTTTGSATSTGGFTYYEVPTIAAGGVSPNVGPIAGGTPITITGTFLTGGTFTIDGLPLLACTVNPAGTQANCTTPAHAAGPVNIAVTTLGGTATSGFTYIAQAITGMTPNFGPTGGGTSVVITGTGFTGSTAFTFGGTAAVCTVNSDTQVTCTSPAHSAGAVDVIITTPSGPATSTGGFTYIPATLTVTASGPATLKPGDQYVYTFAYTTNVTPFSAQVLFTLPGHTTYVSNTGGYVCTPAAGVVTCTLGAITTNGSFTVTVLVDKLKKINTPLALAMASYSISDNGAAVATGLANVTANTLTPFADVNVGYWAIDYIQSIWAYGITSGCANPPLTYCPENNITRAEMAVFIERGVHTSAFNPGTPALTFTDTSANFAKYWIEALKADGITIGCGGTHYCPENPITRGEMSVFLLRGKSFPGTIVLAPATGTYWLDVSTGYWAAAWTERLGMDGISTGCGGGKFCPNDYVSRSQMAVLVQRTFVLTLPTP
jgi:hypothetical protein